MKDLEQIKNDLVHITEDVLAQTNTKAGDIFVVGCSSSEVNGGVIGKNSSAEIGKLIADTLIDLLNSKGIYLAVQGCEHINRALTVEKELAQKLNLEIVSVVPKLHAGGSCATAAYLGMKNPVVVEHIVADAGIDIGDTAIGMHIRHVQIPIRPAIKELGHAHVTALGHRPKKIGGERAEYI